MISSISKLLQTMPGQFDDETCWRAVLARDPAQDGKFFYGVLSTGVYCRPSCPSRRPRRESVRFFATPEEAENAGLRACRRCRPAAASNYPAARISALCAYIKQHLDDRLTLDALSRQAGLSPFHLQRTFKRATGLTPRQYVDACRLKVLKGGLRAGRSVTRAMTDAGYGSSSRLYERTDSQLGMTPSDYQHGGRGVSVRYLTAGTPIGRMLVAATDKGICSVQFADSESKLIEGLRSEYPRADVAPSGSQVAAWVETMVQHLAGEQPKLDLPLDIRATAFQRKVWEHLRSIPYGVTESYGEVAAALGRPAAARAVARACATNPVAIAIPCHRVIQGTGEPGGYRWGAERKKKLLAQEVAGRRS